MEITNSPASPILSPHLWFAFTVRRKLVTIPTITCVNLRQQQKNKLYQRSPSNNNIQTYSYKIFNFYYNGIWSITLLTHNPRHTNFVRFNQLRAPLHILFSIFSIFAHNVSILIFNLYQYAQSKYADIRIFSIINARIKIRKKNIGTTI